VTEPPAIPSLEEDLRDLARNWRRDVFEGGGLEEFAVAARQLETILDRHAVPTGPSSCPFCAIVHRGAAAGGLVRLTNSVSFIPLNPVVPGHRLVVPKVHVEDFAQDPATTASVCRDAAVVARSMSAEAVNLITSWGEAATQTVKHLHIHLVPRAPGDGLALPWTGQETGQQPAHESADAGEGS
jgi:histidine triad (HIT) family protein